MSATGWYGNYLRGVSEIEQGMARRRGKQREAHRRERALEAEGEQSDLGMLRDEVAELKLVVATLVRATLAKGLVGEAELLEHAEVIDRLDGSADGKLRGRVESDGTVTPEAPRPRTKLDDLADAASDRD